MTSTPVFVAGIGPPLAQIRADHAHSEDRSSRDIIALIDAYMALRHEVEMDACDQAVEAGFGASEWEGFVSKRLWAALGYIEPATSLAPPKAEA